MAERVERRLDQRFPHGGLRWDAWRKLRRNPLFSAAAGLAVALVVMAIAPGLFTGADPTDCDLTQSLTRPSVANWFGRDFQGCDIYARVVYGARASMAVGVLAVGLSTGVAVVLGALAGWFGGAIDAAVSRLADVWLALPVMLGGIVILSALGRRGLLEISVTLAALVWPTPLRLVRAGVLQAKELDYVHAARALGAKPLRILCRHVLPNTLPPVLVYAMISVGTAIGAEAALSFLGVGLALPAISWGLMISAAEPHLRQDPHLLFFPALFLSLTVLAFVLIGDALRDAFDPKTQ